MATITVGQGTYVGFGVEATPGTEATRTHWYAVTSTTIRESVESELISTLSQRAGAAASQSQTLKRSVAGDVTMRLSYRSFGIFLKALLGDDNAGTPSGGYTEYTYVPDAAGRNAFTVQIARSNDKSALYTGLYLSKAVFTFESGAGAATVVLSFMGGQSSEYGSTSSIGAVGSLVTGHTDDTLLVSHEDCVRSAGDTSFDWDGITLAGVQSATVTIDNKFDNHFELGSLFPVGIYSTALPTYDVEVTKLYENDDFITHAAVGTRGDLVFNFVSVSNDFGFTLTSARLMELSGDDAQDPGRTNQTMRFAGMTNSAGTNFGIIVNNTSEDATYDDN